MKKVADSFELTATDLVGYLYCHHLSSLDRAVAQGALAKPKIWDPLPERGAAHEQSYVEHLLKAGRDAVRIGGIKVRAPPSPIARCNAARFPSDPFVSAVR